MLGINYSANHSTHLPWGGYSSTSNRNFIPSAVRQQYSSEDLSELVDNPFRAAFQWTEAPSSTSRSRAMAILRCRCSICCAPIRNLMAPFRAAIDSPRRSWYNSLQVRLPKARQASISVLRGQLHLVEADDNSSTGFNAFVGTLNNGNPQELDNLKAEWSVSANDATNRFVAALLRNSP